MHDDLCRVLRRVLYVVARYVFWRGNYRPLRMFRDNRLPDREFVPTESLYFRCVREWVDSQNRIKPAHIRFPDQSVNRAN